MYKGFFLLYGVTDDKGAVISDSVPPSKFPLPTRYMAFLQPVANISEQGTEEKIPMTSSGYMFNK